MQDDFMNMFNLQAQSLFEPLAKLNSLWVSNLESVANFQLEAMTSYSKLGISQIRKAIDIKDVESFQAFSVSQSEVAEVLNQKIIEDGKQLGEMTQQFVNNAESIWRESMPEKTSTASKKKAA
ncbi:MAG: phasin family protein [Bermanella sp.]